STASRNKPSCPDNRLCCRTRRFTTKAPPEHPRPRPSLLMWSKRASRWCSPLNKTVRKVMTPIEYKDASPAVRAVYDDIKTSRNVPDVNNFWKYLAHDPVTLKRTWESVKEVMAPGALDPVVKEMIYLAVSVTNGCG